MIDDTRFFGARLMVLCVFYIPNKSKHMTEDAFQHAIVGCMYGMAKPYNQSITVGTPA